jgi:chromosome segregation ATPase
MRPLLEQQLEHLHVQVKDQVQAAQSNKESEAQQADLRKAIERQGRLLEELDQSSRDLKTELAQEWETTASLRAIVGEYEEKLDEFEAQEKAQEKAHRKTLAELNARLKQAETESDVARASLQVQEAALEALKAAGEAHEGEIKDLKNEIEGLKMRLKMEKERNKSDEGLAAENDALRSKIGSLEERIAATDAQLEELQRAQQGAADELAAARESVKLSRAISPAFFTNLHARIDTLERIIDAIERTDLQPLSTVDRIRLQSAIRDTKPKKTLEDLRGMVQGQVESVSAE